ncbi:unnamed protein product [Malus baccata var. baccata]
MMLTLISSFQLSRNHFRIFNWSTLTLYLIHWPISGKPGKLVDPLVDLMPMDFKGVWAAMEESQRLGLTKSIGVSNFSSKKIETLLSFASIPPSVNQVEMSPFWQQKKLRDFCKANGIVVIAFSPLGAIGSSWGTNHVLESKVLQDIAEARGKTIAQVLSHFVFLDDIVCWGSVARYKLKQCGYPLTSSIFF